MKTTTIISGAAVFLSTLSSAAPTPNAARTDISQSEVQTERRATEADAAAQPSSELDKKEAIIVRTDNVDENFIKRQDTPVDDTSDACVVM